MAFGKIHHISVLIFHVHHLADFHYILTVAFIVFYLYKHQLSADTLGFVKGLNLDDVQFLVELLLVPQLLNRNEKYLHMLHFRFSSF